MKEEPGGWGSTTGGKAQKSQTNSQQTDKPQSFWDRTDKTRVLCLQSHLIFIFAVEKELISAPGRAVIFC